MALVLFLCVEAPVVLTPPVPEAGALDSGGRYLADGKAPFSLTAS